MSQPQPSKLPLARCLALWKELLLVFRGRAFQQKVTRLMQQGLAPQAFYRSVDSVVQNVLADVLNQYSFDVNDRGMALIATVALEESMEGPRTAPLAALLWQGKVALAVDMLRELLRHFSSSKFQMELNMLHRNRQPDSAGFCENFSKLLAPVYTLVLPKYGFTGGKEGMENMTLVLGRVLREREVQVITMSIDSALYNEMIPQAYALAPDVQHRRWPEKVQVMRLLREQLAALSGPNFQQEVAARWGSMRRQLACAAVARVRPHIWDPEVARLVWGIHFLLGMDDPEAVVARLRCMQEDC